MNISLQTTEEYTHKLYPRVIKQEMLSTQAHKGKENIENGIINKPPVNSESKEQERGIKNR